MASITVIDRSFLFLRRRVFDTRMAVSRSISYVCSLIALALFFFGSEFLIEKFIYNNDEIIDILCAVVGAFLFYSFKLFFDRITDKLFFRKDYDYARSIHEIGPLLNSTIDLKLLLQGIYEFLARTIKPDRIIFLFDEASSPLIFGEKEEDSFAIDALSIDTYREISDRFSIYFKQPFFASDRGDENIMDDRTVAMVHQLGLSAIVPLALREEAHAVMFIGERRCGRMLRSKDISLITVLAEQAEMALRNARLYEKVRQYNDVLEAKVVERTNKIRSMFETQSKFLTEVSHELQTPIAILRGNVEVLRDGHRHEREHALRVIATTVEDMSHLMGNLLESARLKFSKNVFHKKEVHVGILLQEIHEDCSILAADKNIGVFVESGDVWVCADRNKLKEVILNLISNALKHTLSGGFYFPCHKNDRCGSLYHYRRHGVRDIAG